MGDSEFGNFAGNLGFVKSLVWGFKWALGFDAELGFLGEINWKWGFGLEN